MSVDFADSNVILYMFDQQDARKRRIAVELVRMGLAAGTLDISFQVVQEVLNVLTRKLVAPLATTDARQLLGSVLSDLWHIMPSQALYQSALEINERYHFTFYDSLIIAAALEAGCTRLLTEDLQDGQIIETLRIVNPFNAT